MWTSFAPISIEPALPGDIPSLASLHADGFARGWSNSEFRNLLSDPAVVCMVARWSSPWGTRGVVGFALFRSSGEEAELLSTAVASTRRGQGLGGDLLRAGLRALFALGTESVFLEVAEDNVAATALYRRMGFHRVASRPAYYPLPSGERAAALVMRLDLRQETAPERGLGALG